MDQSNPYVTPADMQEYTKLGEELQSITPEKVVKTIAEFTPVVGDVMAAKDIYESYSKGDNVGAAINTLAMAVGVVPVVGDVAVKGIKKLAKTRDVPIETEKLVDEIGEVKSVSNAKQTKVPKDKKTVTAYKLFKTNDKGELFPLFVKMDENKPIPKNKWIKAEEGSLNPKTGKVKSSIGDLAYRPGFHAGDLPMATHIGGKVDLQTGERLKGSMPPNVREENQVWAEVEMLDDVDWQSVANDKARIKKDGSPDVKTAHITDQVPFGGHYRYKTNPNMTGNWLIGGEIKVNKILTSKEVKDINDKAGVSDLPKLSDLGLKFNKGGIVPMELQQQTQMAFMQEGGDVNRTGAMFTPQEPSEKNKDALKQQGTIDEQGGLMQTVEEPDQQMMPFMQEGGLTDDGEKVDSVSGNEVPTGSMDQEVRDDIPAMLSEGEYVVPADVVRFHGVKVFEDLRTAAKKGLQKMEADGRIGGEPMGDPEARLEDFEDDDLPFDVSELQTVGADRLRGMSEGGEVGPRVVPTGSLAYGEGVRLADSTGFQMKKYYEPSTGRIIVFPFFNNRPMSVIPDGFELYTGQDKEPAKASADAGRGRDNPPYVPFKPNEPRKTGFRSFTSKDFIDAADSTRSAIGKVAASLIPFLGMSHSSGKKYIEKTLSEEENPSQINPATGEKITDLDRIAMFKYYNNPPPPSVMQRLFRFVSGKGDLTEQETYGIADMLDFTGELRYNAIDGSTRVGTVDQLLSRLDENGMMPPANAEETGLDVASAVQAGKYPYGQDPNSNIQNVSGTNEIMARDAVARGDDMIQFGGQREDLTKFGPEGIAIDNRPFTIPPLVGGDTAEDIAEAEARANDPVRNILLDEASVPTLESLKDSPTLKRKGAVITDDSGNTVYKAYKDSRGYWTVGPGILLGTIDNQGNQIVSDEAVQKNYPEAEVSNEFIKRVNQSIESVEKNYNTENMPPRVRTTLIGMNFQLGESGLKGFSQMNKAIEEGNYKEASRQVLNNFKTGDVFSFSTDAGAENVGETNLYNQTPNRAIRYANNFLTALSQLSPVTQAAAAEMPPPRPSTIKKTDSSFETPSFVAGMDAVPQAGEAIANLNDPYTPPSGGTGVQDVAPPVAKAEPYTTDAAGFAGDIPPPETSNRYMLERIPEGMGLGPDAYKDPSVTPSFVTAMNQVPPAGEFDDPNNIIYGGDTGAVPQDVGEAIDRPDIVNRIVDSGGQPPQNLSNRAMARKDVTRAQGVPRIGTEGGFRPDAAAITAPTVDERTPRLSYSDFREEDTPRFDTGEFGGEITGQESDRFRPARLGGGVPFDVGETIDANMRSATPRVNYGGRTSDFENLGSQTEQAFMSSAGTPSFEMARRSRPSVTTPERELVQVNAEAGESKVEDKSGTKKKEPSFMDKYFDKSGSVGGFGDDYSQRDFTEQGFMNLQGLGKDKDQRGKAFNAGKLGGGEVHYFRYNTGGGNNTYISEAQLRDYLNKPANYVLTAKDVASFDPTTAKKTVLPEKGLLGEERYTYKQPDIVDTSAEDDAKKAADAKAAADAEARRLEKQQKKQQKKQDEYVAKITKDPFADRSKDYGGGKKYGGRATGGLVKRRATKKKKKS